MTDRTPSRRANARSDIVVVGAGPAGIGAALRLRELGAAAPSWIVLDAGTSAGGLAGTITDEAGYRWDLGGHVIYSHAPEFDRLLELAVAQDDWKHVGRAGWVWHRDRFVAAPFQQNFHQLPASDFDRCIEGLQSRRPATDASFDSWIMSEFGPGLAELFFRPFNFKMWGYRTDRLDSDWVTHRSGSSKANVPKIRTDRPLGRAGQAETPSAPARDTFPYPDGGTGEIWANAARLVGADHFAMEHRVVGVDIDERELHLASGQRISYGALVSTMPLDLLLGMLDGRDDLTRVAPKLVRSATWLVGLGIRGTVPAPLAQKRWMYFADLAIPFHRATVLSNYSPAMVPDPETSWSLLCEISDTAERPADPATIVATVRECAARLVHAWGGREIDHVWSRRLTHGYPTPFLGRNELLPALHRELEAHRIFSRGRFGAWRYEVSNQDHAFMQGYEAIGRIVFGDHEPTLAHRELDVPVAW